GAAVPDPGAEALGGLPARDGTARGRAADRAGRQALDRRLRPRRRGRTGQEVRRRGPEPPGLPRPRPRPETLPRPLHIRPRTATASPCMSNENNLPGPDTADLSGLE